LLQFKTYQELIAGAKAHEGVIVLPHPFNRHSYPSDLVEAMDLYELSNFRGAAKDIRPICVAGKGFIFGSDAHNWLAGYVNNYYSGTDFREALLGGHPIPSLHRADVWFVNKASKLISKIRRTM
jgi:hypothetical protein